MKGCRHVQPLDSMRRRKLVSNFGPPRLAAGKLAQFDGGKRVPATISARLAEGLIDSYFRPARGRRPVSRILGLQIRVTEKD